MRGLNASNVLFSVSNMPISTITERDFDRYLDDNPGIERTPFSPGGLTVVVYYHPIGTTWRQWSVRRAISVNIRDDEKLKKSEQIFEQRT